MSIQPGEKIPSAQLMHLTDAGPTPITTEELFGGKAVALFALPGAFTPTCSNQHLPGFVEKSEELRGKGIEPSFAFPSMTLSLWALGANNKAPTAK